VRSSDCGRQARGRKEVLRDAVAKPSATVSKEQSAVLLATLIGKTDPAKRARCSSRSAPNAVRSAAPRSRPWAKSVPAPGNSAPGGAASAPRASSFPSESTRGRRYPEPAHPYRNDFRRDRDRVVHSRAFRRLEDKTQVFSPGVSDHFRNRLTHTLEVSQIARTVAGVLGLDEDLTEALALAHDIGHPPLAHAGEEELDRLMRRFGERFEHNLHALRIVESFEHPYARFPA